MHIAPHGRCLPPGDLRNQAIATYGDGKCALDVWKGAKKMGEIMSPLKVIAEPTSATLTAKNVSKADADMEKAKMEALEAVADGGDAVDDGELDNILSGGMGAGGSQDAAVEGAAVIDDDSDDVRAACRPACASRRRILIEYFNHALKISITSARRAMQCHLLIARVRMHMPLSVAGIRRRRHHAVSEAQGAAAAARALLARRQGGQRGPIVVQGEEGEEGQGRVAEGQEGEGRRRACGGRAQAQPRRPVRRQARHVREETEDHPGGRPRLAREKERCASCRVW